MNSDLISRLKLYYFGKANINEEEILLEHKSDQKNFRNALARTRGPKPVLASIHPLPNGDFSLSIHVEESLLIEVIKKTLNCSECVAKDVYHLRTQLNWTIEKEQELLDYHKAGVPSNVSLFSHA
jgi:hypothetical protein